MTEQQALKRKKIKIWIMISIGIVLMILGAYYFYQAHQTKYYYMAQNDNDAVNPTGTRAVCFSAGYLIDYPEDLPYTIKYIDGDFENASWPDDILVNRSVNRKLSAFAQVGLLSEEKVGEDEQGRPIYRYDLTDKGRGYVYWRRGMNFCFGRVIVEKDSISTWKKSFVDQDKAIHYKFHYENVPDWVMADVIKNLNTVNYQNYRDALYKKHGSGSVRYDIDYNGDWILRWASSDITVP